MKSLKEVLLEGEKSLQQAGIIEATQDAWFLFSYVFETYRGDYVLNQNSPADDERVKQYSEMIEARITGKPAQYITGHQEFMGLDFQVNQNVFIPRQDTEILVAEALKLIKKKKTCRKILDLCTGSGCIAISISKYAPECSVTASDVSKKALETAVVNAKKNQSDIRFVQSDLFDEIEGKFDLIVSIHPTYERMKSES
jgi:release factor glutamine methyltransferase